MVYFVPSTLGFIPKEWKKDGTYTDASWPKDAVLLSDAQAGRFWKQSSPDGRILGSTDKGQPVWIPAPAQAPATTADIESSRLRAYADPLTGSDRLFSESMRMQIMNESGFEEVRARAIARFEEIKAQYPWASK